MDLTPIYKWVDDHKDKCMEALRTVIRQPSCAAQDNGVKECAALLADIMKAVGIDARVMPAAGQPYVF